MSETTSSTTASSVAPPLQCPLCTFGMDRDASQPFGSEPVFCGRATCGVQLFQDDNHDIHVRTFRLNHHETLCLFPFAFGAFDESAQDSFATLRRSPRWHQITFDPNVSDDIERTEYFLPYARRFLFPSLDNKANDAIPNEQEPSCQHFRFDLEQLGGLSSEESIAFVLHGQDDRKKRTYRYEMELKDIRLTVFNYHVGFLILRVSHTEPMATYFDQMNAAVYLRLIAPLYPGFNMPTLDLNGDAIQMTQLLPYLLAEFSSAPTLPAAPSAFDPNQPKHVWLPVKPFYDDRMMLYQFSCIQGSTALDNPDQNAELLGRHSVINFHPDLQEASLQPKPDLVDISQWVQQRWWGFSKEGGCLAVFDANRFHERFLGRYFTTYYYDIFLLAAMQRVTLLLLFERLSDIPSLTTGSSESRTVLRRLRKDLLLFKNQSWFSQLTNRERGLQLWRNWQGVFENRTLLDEVNEQAQELDAYLQSLSRERLDWVIRLGGFLATAVPAVVGLPVLFGKAPWVFTVRWVLLIGLLLGTCAFAWRIFRQNDDD